MNEDLIHPQIPEGYRQRQKDGKRNDLDRAYDRLRQRRARALRNQEQHDVVEPDQDTANPEERIARITAEATTNRGNVPGEKIPLDDPALIEARNDKFDKERAECELRSALISRRTLWALSHNIPGGWANSEIGEHMFPPELRLERLKDGQEI
jgi:hypothetical protein